MSRHGMTGFDQIAIASVKSGNKLGDTTHFGRLLPQGAEVKRDEVAPALAKLAKSMDEGFNPEASEDDPNVPLGFVFLGQFIDHDLTLDVTTSLKRAIDVNLIPDVRTPVLDLDSLYDDGPEASSYLYRRATNGPQFKGRFLIGNAQNPLDLPRNSDGIALIGDPRNDENGLLSQLHLLFLRFHNAVLDAVENDDYDEVYDEEVIGKEVALEQTQRAVRRHYQWIVVNEFLPKIVDAQVLKQAKDDVISGNYKNDSIWGNAPIIPIEFAGAAYRFGHSMVRNTYTLNQQRQNVELFKNKDQTIEQGLPSNNFVPPENVIDWRYFFEIDPNISPQKVRRINTKMAHEFYDLPFVPPSEAALGENSLAFRNLLRGTLTLSLPTGEAVAKAFGVTPIPKHPKVEAAGLSETPLWFYCLAEGEHYNDKLGPVGGRIVAMTLLRILKEDPESYLNRPNWKPYLGERSGEFTIADIVKFVNKYQPAHKEPQPQPVVNFGEQFYLKGEDGKSIIASWQDPNDSSYHRIYPKFGASGEITLKFQGASGELINNTAVQIVSTESSVGKYSIMGAWASKDACYYWTDHNSQMQWWQITKVDGGDPKIHYGDKVYINNRSWNQPLAPYNNEYVSGKVSHNQYVWTVEKEPASSSSSVGTSSPAADVKVGPMGGGGGSEFVDVIPPGAKVIGLKIASANRIDSIQVSLNTGILEKHGGGGGKLHQINFQQGEYITAIYGRSGKVLDGITIRTNKKTYGPFGGDGGKEFSLEAPQGFEIVGFFGSSGRLVDSIGAIIRHS
ncbi:MAG: peroxidase family protein [Cyanobacteria bacterium P01_D01_bin.50]